MAFLWVLCLLFLCVVAEGEGAHSLPPCGKELQDISAFPGDERYNQSLVIYNPAYSSLHPAFFAIPKSEKDVQRCLKCAYESHVSVVLRSGGHSEAGYSSIGSEGFVIYLTEMNRVVIDDTTKVIHVQAGARWRDVYDKTGSDYLIVGGACPSVGVSGYTLGGGYSFLSRYLGLAIDNLLSATMVTANGSSVVSVNSTVNPDLFWALRGGGGGNFGAVTEFTFQLHPIHPNYVFGFLTFLGNQTSPMLELFGAAALLPKEVNLEVAIFPSQRSIMSTLFIGNYEDAMKVLKPFIELASEVDVKNYSSYKDVLEIVGKDFPDVSSHPEMLRGCTIKAMTNQVANIFSEADVPSSCMMILDLYGGSIKGNAPNATAFYHRNASMHFFSPCQYSNQTEYAEVSQFEDKIFDSLMQGGHCAGGYINDLDPKVSNWQHFYYGENYKRLVEIKQKWNPIGSGTLHFHQEIGSTYQPKAYVELPWKHSSL